MWLRSTLAVAALAAGVSTPPPAVDYPTGYRRWVHIKSAVVGPDSPAFARFGGLHHIYANPPALKGYARGRFPEGSVLVFDVLDANAKGSSIETGARRQIDVMAKQGGTWRYTEFVGDSRTERSPFLADGGRSCETCHAKAPGDHVFSRAPADL